MLNALRYGFATFLSFSKPLTFFLLAAITTYLVFALTQVLSLMTASSNGSVVELLGFVGFDTSVMNVMVMFFLSVPVAGQFAQEYRFNTLANTFLLAPSRVAVFVSKTAFALLYVIISIAVIWISFRLIVTLYPPTPLGAGTISPLVTTNLDFAWHVTASDTWKVLLYVSAYMLIVIGLSTVTRSQTLGVLIPMFYLLFIETAIMLAAAYFDAMRIPIPSALGSFRFYMQGQAWINEDPNFPYAPIIYFGGAILIALWSLILFVRRDSSIRA